MKVLKITGTSSEMQVYLKDGSVLQLEGEFTQGGFAAYISTMRLKGSDRALSEAEKEDYSREILEYNRNRGNKDFRIELYPD